MPLLMFAGAVALTAALQAAAPPKLDADLYCRGRGDRFVTTTTKVRNADGSITTRTDNSRVPFTGPIRIQSAAARARR